MNKEENVKVNEKPIIVRKRAIRKKTRFFRCFSSLKDVMLMALALALAIWIFAFVFPMLIILGFAYFIYRYFKRKRLLD